MKDKALCLIRRNAKGIAAAGVALGAALTAHGTALPPAALLAGVIVYAIPNKVCNP